MELSTAVEETKKQIENGIEPFLRTIDVEIETVQELEKIAEQVRKRTDARDRTNWNTDFYNAKRELNK